jgi:hypothetical protein
VFEEITNQIQILIADAVKEEQERIIAILRDPVFADLSRPHLIGVIQGASLDGEWD